MMSTVKPMPIIQKSCAKRTSILEPDLDGRWESAMAKLGINLHMLSGDAGRA